MDAAERGGARLDQLYAEARQLVSYGANQLRAIATRYREAYADVLATARLQREELEALSHGPADPGNEARRAPPCSRHWRRPPRSSASGRSSRPSWNS